MQPIRAQRRPPCPPADVASHPHLLCRMASTVGGRIHDAGVCCTHVKAALQDDPNLGMPAPFNPRRGAPLPPDAAARQEELDSLNILDTARDQNFDDVSTFCWPA